MKKTAKFTLLPLILALVLSACASTSPDNTSPVEELGVTDEGNRVWRINESDERGYAIAAYLVIPPTVNLDHLVVYPYKSGKLGSYKAKDAIVREIVMEGYGRYNEITRHCGAVSLFLVIPETSNNFRHLELDPWTLESNDKYRHLDDQVDRLIAFTLDFLDTQLGISLPERVDMVGYSGEGNFILRFALLHPQRLWCACAGGVSWSPSLATATLEGEELTYPLGIADIGRYSDDFDLEAWKAIRFFVDMGLRDDRGSYNHEQLEDMSWSRDWALDGEWEEIWKVFAQTFAKITDNAELVSFIDMGHEHNFSRHADFISENDDESQPFTPVPTLEESLVLVSGGTEWKRSVGFEWHD